MKKRIPVVARLSCLPVSELSQLVPRLQAAQAIVPIRLTTRWLRAAEYLLAAKKVEVSNVQ